MARIEVTLGVDIGGTNTIPNLSWGYVDVAAETKKYYTVPVSLTNDANAAALGEMLFGADSFAGEIGHTI